MYFFKKMAALASLGCLLAPALRAQETITVNGTSQGVSTQYMGVTDQPEASGHVAGIKAMGASVTRLFTSVSRLEPTDDDGVYGAPSIASLKSNFGQISWSVWDNTLTSSGFKAYLQNAKSNGVKVIVNLRTRTPDERGVAPWLPANPTSVADEAEWWEHCAAVAYWMNVRNDFRVDDYQILNEPDRADQSFTGSANDYARLAKIARDAVQFVYTNYLSGRSYNTLGPVSSYPNGTFIHDVFGSTAAANTPNVGTAYAKGGDALTINDYHHYATGQGFADGITYAWGFAYDKGYGNLPVWNSEWGSYDFSIDGNPHNSDPAWGVKFLNNILTMCLPDHHHVTGWNYYTYQSSDGYGLTDGSNNPRPMYYALRLIMRGLNGGKPTFDSPASNGNLKALTAKDADGTINLVVTNAGSSGYTINANVAALSPQLGGTSTLYRYDAQNNDAQLTGPVVGANGVVQFSIPANAAVLLRIPPSGSTPPPATTLRTPDNPAGAVAGLRYQYYTGSFNTLPDFTTLTPAKTGTVATPDLAPRTQDDNFAFRYTGFVTVPQDGQYTFFTSSDDGSQLFIGNQLVVDNNGLHAAQERSGTIGLKAGTHALAVTFFELNGGQSLSVSYQGPGLSKQAIPASAFSYVPAAAGGIVSGGVYRLTPKSAPSKCLDVDGVSQANGANVQQWEYLGGLNQQWKVVSTGDGYYKLVSANSPAGVEKVLDVANCLSGNNAIANGQNVQQMQWFDNACQRWKFTLLPDGSYKINPKSALDQGWDQVLTVNNCSPDNNSAGQANVLQYQWGDQSCQHWSLTLISSPSARSAAAAPAASQPASATLQVYPNPATERLTVQLPAPGAGTLSLRDLLGRVVRQQALPAEASQGQLDVRGLPQGFYLLQVQQPGQPSRTQQVLVRP